MFGSLVELYVKNLSKAEEINETWTLDEMLYTARLKCSVTTYPCYVVQQMSNNDLGISHLRFRNRKNTWRGRAYRTALLNLYKSLLHRNNCLSKVAFSRWCQWGYDSWTHQGRAVKKTVECVLAVSYFPMALILPSSVEMRRINFFCEGR